LEKILSNLLSNAFKFTQEEGQVQLIARVAAGFLELEVSDNGLGIPTEQLPHIFDRFYSLGHTPEMESSGIGLALTKELVELQQGRIYVESQEGKGSSFHLTLPVDEQLLQAGPTLLPTPANLPPIRKRS